MNLLLPHIILAATALAAGIQNAMAGGGTLYTFPALEHYVGPVHANATSTVALVTGSIAGAWGFREELKSTRKWLWWLVPPCLVGGVIGTWLVMAFPESVFKALVPWLILAAATLFLLQPYIAKWVGAGKPHEEPSPLVKLGVVVFQFIVAIYGGYFGAGIGILMISSLSMMGLGDIHRVNALKAFLAACINIVSVFMWVAGGKVEWRFVPVMAAAAIVGGYAGARLSQRMNKKLLRWLIIGIGFGLSAYYFARRFNLL